MKRTAGAVIALMILASCAVGPSGPPRNSLTLQPVRSYVEVEELPVGASFSIKKDSEMQSLIEEAIASNKLLSTGIALYNIYDAISSIGRSENEYLVFSSGKPFIGVTQTGGNDNKKKVTTYTLKNAPTYLTFEKKNIVYRNYTYNTFSTYAPSFVSLKKEENTYMKRGLEGAQVQFGLYSFVMESKGILVPTFHMKNAKPVGTYTATIGSKSCNAYPVFVWHLPYDEEVKILREDQLIPGRTRKLTDNYREEGSDDLEFLLALGYLDNSDVRGFAKSSLNQ